MIETIEFVVRLLGWVYVALFLAVFAWIAAHEVASVWRRRASARPGRAAKVTPIERYRVRRGWQPQPDRRVR